MSSFSPIKELPAESVQLPAEQLVDADEWLRFNVGGVMLETSRATIEKLKSSFFAQLLDHGTDDDRAPIDGVYRIDRDPQALQVFLNYGRYGKIVAVPDHVSESFLVHEHNFYGMKKAIVDAIGAYFVERSKGPNSIQLERVTIREMAMDKGYMHHNVYGLVSGRQLCCFTNVPGNGICYKDVGRWFIYEKPHDKYPALFRSSCSRCKHQVCLADDALVGLEGWCHKCSLCLRCQDILCEATPLRDEVGRTDASNVPNGTRVIRKTASVVFVSDVAPVVLSPADSGDDDADDDDEETYLRSIIKDPLSEMVLKNRQKGVSGLAGRKFSLIPPENDGSKHIEPNNTRLILPKLVNKSAAAKTEFPKGVRHRRRHTEPAAFGIDQFANFLQGGKW